MARRILGDDPFAPSEGDKPSGKPASAKAASGKAAPATRAKAGAKPAGRSAKARPARKSTRTKPASHEPPATEADADSPAEHDADSPAEHDADSPAEHDADSPAEHDADSPAEHDADSPAEHDADSLAESELHSDAEPELASFHQPEPDIAEQVSPVTTTDRVVGSTPAPHPSAFAEDTSEYGPSIDRPHGLHARERGGPLRRRAVEALRRLEESARGALGSPYGDQGRQTPPLEFLWSRWRTLAMRDRSEVVDEFGRDPSVAEQFAPFLDFFYRTWFRVETRGLEHIPAAGRALIVGNHSGTLPYDGAMLMHGVRVAHPAHREVRPLVEDFVFHFPYLGTLMNRIGGVRACQENAERLLRKDQLVAVFPEGIKGIGKLFAQRYQLQRFGRGGFIKLALATDSPIIPAAIVGAEEIHPLLTKVTWLSKATHIPYLPVTPTFPWLGPLGLVPFPTRWYIAFGEPLYFNAEYGEGAAADRILVGKLAEQVRQKIQEMIDGLLQQRRSVFFG